MEINNVSLILTTGPLPLPLFNHSASAGIPYPTDDHIRDVVNLNEFLVKEPSASYLVEVKGDSMIYAGIEDGDMLVVDCSIGAVNNDIIIASLNGDLTVKRYVVEHGITYLVAENYKYNKIEVRPDDSFEVIGVVLRSIRNHCPRIR
jgi:DNA polymerase V